MNDNYQAKTIQPKRNFINLKILNTSKGVRFLILDSANSFDNSNN